MRAGRKMKALKVVACQGQCNIGMATKDGTENCLHRPSGNRR